MLKIECIETGPINTNCYVVYDEQNKSSFIIDCAVEGYEDIKNFIDTNLLNPKFIILTHTHWDHSGDAYKLKNNYNIDIMCHKDDEYRLINPKEHSVFNIPYEMQGISSDKYLHDNDIINFDNYEFRVIHTPGHTEGSISIYSQEHKIAFVGDLLFKDSIGRTDLPGGNFNQIIQSLKKIIDIFDENTIIYSGHGSSTTFKDEINSNPFILNYLELSKS